MYRIPCAQCLQGILVQVKIAKTLFVARKEVVCESPAIGQCVQPGHFQSSACFNRNYRIFRGVSIKAFSKAVQPCSSPNPLNVTSLTRSSVTILADDCIELPYILVLTPTLS